MFWFKDATRANQGKSAVTDFEIEEIVKRWFQNTRDLDGGRTVRKEKAACRRTEAEEGGFKPK